MAESEAVLLQRARAWMSGDPDPETRAELGRLVAARDIPELRECMGAGLEFGTAGIRGLLGAGPSRMNRAVVIRTTRAVADYLLATQPDARIRPVIVAYDARHASRDFAQSAAGVLAAAGIRVRYFEQAVPTPLAVHAAGQLGAVAALVITASHNPAGYGGYKLYDSTAAQIVPPADQQIAARIGAVAAAADVPCAPAVLDGGHPHGERLPDSLFDRYLAQLDALRPPGCADRSLRIVYTPLHGVGWKFVRQTLHRGGYRNVHVVSEQAQPDGTFPTTAVPNPEEAAALRLAIQLAERLDAHLVLANDPDADRLAVCVPVAARRWTPLTGNQVGLLLADFLLQHASTSPRPLVVSTLVSSPMLEGIVRHYGARVEWTFTGFKWIASAARHLEQAGGVRFLFGYEEAMGYTPGRLLRDKDGIGAGLLFADLAAHLRAQGLSVAERLAQLYRRHGLWASAQHSVICPGSDGAARIGAALAELARHPPQTVCGWRVVASRDYFTAAAERPTWRSVAPLVELALEREGRVLVRPSGTEPKLKIYVDLRASAAGDQSIAQQQEQARASARAIAVQMARQVGLE
jgi:phosphomannomutase